MQGQKKLQGIENGIEFSSTPWGSKKWAIAASEKQVIFADVDVWEYDVSVLLWSSSSFIALHYNGVEKHPFLFE